MTFIIVVDVCPALVKKALLILNQLMLSQGLVFQTYPKLAILIMDLRIFFIQLPGLLGFLIFLD